MVKALLFDFSRTLLHPGEEAGKGSVNGYYKKLVISGDYNFHEHFHFDEALLAFLDTIKNNYSLSIYTSGSIQEDEEVTKRIGGLFKKIFTVPGIGKEKTDPDAYRVIAADLGYEPSEIVFIDDLQENIIAAEQAGLQVVHYKNSEQVVRDIKMIIGIA